MLTGAGFDYNHMYPYVLKRRATTPSQEMPAIVRNIDVSQRDLTERDQPIQQSDRGGLSAERRLCLRKLAGIIPFNARLAAR
jgi:hypothetical protein